MPVDRVGVAGSTQRYRELFMSTTESIIIEVAPLLTPISDDKPAGENLKHTDLYFRIEEARKKAERASVDGNETPDWQEVIDLAVDALTTKTKDLMLGAYLTEALTREFSYAGLADGLRLMAGLLREYWDHLFPQLQDGEFGARLAPLNWLMATDNGSRMGNRIRELPMAPTADDGKVFSWRLWTTPPGKPIEGESAEVDDRQLFQKAIASANRAYYQKLVDEVHAAQEALKTFDSAIDERFGDQSPTTTKFRESLEACATLAEQFLDQKGGPAAQADFDSCSDAERNSPSSGDRSGSSAAAESSRRGPIRNREEALRRLEEAASYLRETEPQSPVPYLIDRAVSWGRMPFDQLLNELFADDNTRGQVRNLLGIRPSDS
jgi:type VI secretion system protein ImpA